jgi:hypothetical protein
MPSITNQVRGELLHHVRSRWIGISAVEREFQRQPFRVRRPGDGQPPADGEATCETCGETVPYRIMSAGSTLLRRRIWLVVSLAGAAFAATSFVLICSGASLWGLIGGPVGIGMVFGAGAARAGEDGVRVGRVKSAYRHFVRSGTMSTEGYERW